MPQTAILGAGVMGETLLSGLVRAGRRVDDLLVGEKRPDRARELEERYGVQVVSNIEATRKADTLALVVKPQDMGDLLDEIAPELRPGQLVVSLAAGITTAFIEARVPEGVAVVRVMPNTPALVDEGMAAIAPGSHCDDRHLAEAEELMGSTGRVLRVPERQMDAVTAISGSGPAYIFFVVESMIEAGVHLGLPRSTSTELVVQTLVGSAKMLRETGTHPVVLREQVTSPGGTTAAALRELETHKVRAAFLAAMEAARDRSRSLAEGNLTFCPSASLRTCRVGDPQSSEQRHDGRPGRRAQLARHVAGGLAQQREHRVGDGLLAGGQHDRDGGDGLGVAIGDGYGDRGLAEDRFLVLDGVRLLDHLDEGLLESLGLDDASRP